MTKQHCDICDREIRYGDLLLTFSRPAKYDKISAYISAGGGRDTDMTYDICKYCLVDKLKQVDDRPKCSKT